LGKREEFIMEAHRLLGQTDDDFSVHWRSKFTRTRGWWGGLWGEKSWRRQVFMEMGWNCFEEGFAGSLNREISVRFTNDTVTFSKEDKPKNREEVQANTTSMFAKLHQIHLYFESIE
jgi:hypothetical protein